MATSVWKGHLTFGLVSIPVKLYRAARAEKVEFRQVHEATGTRVRQTLYREPEEPADLPTSAEQRQLLPTTQASGRSQAAALGRTLAFPAPPPLIEVSRSELAKGYEYEKDRYLVLSRDEIEAITPRTAYEMEILQFVKLAEVDPIYYETSYYVAPDRAGQRAYALLLEALRRSGLVAMAQVAMHRREHVVVIRPGRTGIVLHTMFYESEIRREDEQRTDISQVSGKELELALLLVNSLAGAFDSSKYRDSYREKLDALIAAKLEGLPRVEAKPASRTPVINIMEALQRSLDASERKAAASEGPAAKTRKKKSRAK